jgi:hypothetical protein
MQLLPLFCIASPTSPRQFDCCCIAVIPTHNFVFLSSHTMVMATIQTFLAAAAASMPSFDRRQNNTTFHRRWMATFGVTPFLLATIWNLLDPVRNAILCQAPCQPKHLLWTFTFFKVYTTENVMHALIGADEKTFRKYVNLFACALAAEYPRLVSKSCCWLLHDD